MELTYSCRKCAAIDRVAKIEDASQTTCPACGEIRAVHREAFDQGNLRCCAVCGTEDLYIQKDFPQRLGIVIVVVGFAISSVFWYYERPLWTYAILLTSALLDMVLFYRVPNVTICYRCLVQHRGVGSNPVDEAGRPRFKPFDLAIGERYRQERFRIEEIRQRERKTE